MEHETEDNDRFIQLSDPHAPPITEEMRKQLKGIQRDLFEVFPQSLEEWESNLLLSNWPQKRLRVWQWIHLTYLRLTLEDRFDLQQRSALLRVCLAVANTGAEEALKVTDFTPLTLEEAEKVVASMLAELEDWFNGAAR